jgi:tetratricopeptide (TPR) repeat protein
MLEDQHLRCGSVLRRILLHAGLRNAAGSISTFRGRARIGFAIASCVSAGALTAGPRAWAACAGPAALEAQVRAHPGTGAYADLGVWFYQNHQTECAVAPLKEAVRLHPEDLQAHLLLGAVLARLGRNQEAASEWSAALKIDPGSKAALDGQ